MKTPYKGLAPYDAGDRDRFFGREDDRKILIAKLFSARVTLFFGVTGSGKSSLLRAGVIPELTDPEGYNLDVIYHSKWNPREDPRLSLKTSIKEALFTSGIISSENPSGWKEATLQGFLERYDVFASDPLVIIIDQFEEPLLYHAYSPFLNDFIQDLSDAINDRELSVAFLFSMREDFLAELDVFWDKMPSFFDNRYRLEKLTIDQAREAIVRPVEAVNSQYEPELVKHLLNHLSGQESDDHDNGEPSLRPQEGRRFVDAPYLQIVCQKLWEDAQTNQQSTLTLSRYEELGRTKNIVREYIEGVIDKLTLREQVLAFEMFQYLVTRRGTKMAYRAEDLADTLGVSIEEVCPTLDKLAKPDIRILRLDNRHNEIWYELYHDIFAEIIRGWTEQFQKDESRYIYSQIATAAWKWQWDKEEKYLLREEQLISAEEWLRKNPETLSPKEQDFLQASEDYEREHTDIRTIISRAAHKWIGEKRDKDLLLKGSRLLQAEEWAKNHLEALSQEEKGFLKQSLKRRYRWVWMRRGIIAAVTLFAVIATALGFYANMQRKEAEEARNEARSGQLAANALLNDQLDLALLLSAEAFRIADTVEARSALLTSLLERPYLSTFLYSRTDNILSFAFSENDNLLALDSSVDTSIRLWNVQTGRLEREFLRGSADDILSIAFSPNGKWLVSYSMDNTICLWNVKTDESVQQSFTGPEDGVLSIAVSPDGTLLALGGWENTIRLWDATGQPTGDPLEGHTDAVSSVAFSPDGALLASGGRDNTIRLWNVTERKPIETEDPAKDPMAIVLDHSAPVVNVDFSPNGDTIASISMDMTITLWEDIEQSIHSGALPSKTYLTKHTEEMGQVVPSIAFSPNGKLLASGCGDNTVCLWDATSSLSIGKLFTDDMDTVETLAFSPNGKLLASGGWDNMIHLWDVATGQEEAGSPLKGHEDDVLTIAFSPDGILLASGGWDTTIRLWNVATGQEEARSPLNGHTDTIESVAFSPDGKLLASSGWDTTVHLWDLATDEVKVLKGHTGAGQSVAFSPDGKLLASGSADTTIRLWDLATDEVKVLKGHTGPVESVTFSPDGKLLASGSADTTIRLWDLATDEVKVLKGHTRPVESVTFSPDGDLLASSGEDQIIILWDIATQQTVGKLFAGHTASVKSVAFHPDGKQLISGGWDQRIILWNLDPGFWQKQACRMANRNLDYQEWQQYFPDEDYRKICADLPTPEED